MKARQSKLKLIYCALFDKRFDDKIDYDSQELFDRCYNKVMSDKIKYSEIAKENQTISEKLYYLENNHKFAKEYLEHTKQKEYDQKEKEYQNKIERLKEIIDEQKSVLQEGQNQSYQIISNDQEGYINNKQDNKSVKVKSINNEIESLRVYHQNTKIGFHYYDYKKYYIHLNEEQKVKGCQAILDLLKRKNKYWSLNLIIFLNCYDSLYQITDGFRNYPKEKTFEKKYYKIQRSKNLIIHSNVFKMTYTIPETDYKLLEDLTKDLYLHLKRVC